MISPPWQGGQDQGVVLGPDFWETARAVAPIVGATVAVAVAYLRFFIRSENRTQKDDMMREIRELFAMRSEVASLKELITMQIGALKERVEKIESNP